MKLILEIKKKLQGWVQTLRFLILTEKSLVLFLTQWNKVTTDQQCSYQLVLLKNYPDTVYLVNVMYLQDFWYMHPAPDSLANWRLVCADFVHQPPTVGDARRLSFRAREPAVAVV